MDPTRHLRRSPWDIVSCWPPPRPPRPPSDYTTAEAVIDLLVEEPGLSQRPVIVKDG
ncbi:MAG: hypothetical protein GY698_01470 [Actinomycetia bacterium]|nr:hypothetical protein [Actinomycetes bacterium]